MPLVRPTKKIIPHGPTSVVALRIGPDLSLFYLLVADDTVVGQSSDGQTFTLLAFEPKADPITLATIQKALHAWAIEKYGSELKAKTRIVQIGLKQARVEVLTGHEMILDIDLNKTNVVRSAFAEEKLPPLE